jgi:hypothetical protein
VAVVDCPRKLEMDLRLKKVLKMEVLPTAAQEAWPKNCLLLILFFVPMAVYFTML